MTQYVKDQPASFSNKIENVAIIGASGQMGSHIVIELLKNPQFKITALTRKGGKSEFPKGIHNIVEVDYDQQESIVQSLKGQDTLITALAVNAPKDLPKRIVDAAVEANVRWFIPDYWGGDFGDNQSAKEETFWGAPKVALNQYISSKGLPWTAIGNGFWYEWSLSGGIQMFGIDIKERKVNFYEQGKIPQSTSTWRLSARALASLLALPIYPQDQNDKSVTISNWKDSYLNVQSFHLDQRQMLNAVQKATNTTDSDWQINNVNVKEVWKGAADILKSGDGSAFVLALYSRTFFPDRPADNDAKCQNDMKALGLTEDESLEDVTKRTIQMAEDAYVQNFFAKKR